MPRLNVDHSTNNSIGSKIKHTVMTVLEPLGQDHLGAISPQEHLFLDLTFEAITPCSEEVLKLFESPVGSNSIVMMQ